MAHLTTCCRLGSTKLLLRLLDMVWAALVLCEKAKLRTPKGYGEQPEGEEGVAAPKLPALLCAISGGRP